MKPSYGQVLGYIQEGEPLALDLPKRNASIYTSSHWYLDDYPNAPEPVSETPLPHTSINPAAAFETADEGYDGVPFQFTRPSFLPDSDDGGTDPGQALRNDGLDPPRPPRLGGRMRESGIQAVAGGAAGAAAAVRSVLENQTMNVLRGGGDWLDRTLRIPRRPPGLAPFWTRCRPLKSSEGPAKWSSGAEGGGGGAPGGAGHRAVRLAADGGGGSNRRLRFGGGGGGRGSGDGGGRGNGRSSDRPGRRRPGCGRRCGRSDRGTGGRGGGGGRGRHGLGDRGRSQRCLAHAGLGRRDGRRHGQRRLAAFPSHGRPDSERHARFRRRGSLLHLRAAAAAAGLPDRHGLRERAAGPASATDSSSPHPAPGPGPAAAHALRHQPGAHPGELRERTVPHQPAVPGRPRAAGHAVLRRPSHGERTGSCIMYKGWRT